MDPSRLVILNSAWHSQRILTGVLQGHGAHNQLMEIAMKLGRDTGSVMNHVLSRSVIGQPDPTVGMGATVLLWSDRHACTVIAWDGKKSILTIQQDSSQRLDKNGLSESQQYEFTPDPSGRVYRFKRMPEGTWREMTTSEKGNLVFSKSGAGLMIGRREEYYDPSF